MADLSERIDNLSLASESSPAASSLRHKRSQRFTVPLQAPPAAVPPVPSLPHDFPSTESVSSDTSSPAIPSHQFHSSATTISPPPSDLSFGHMNYPNSYGTTAPSPTTLYPPSKQPQSRDVPDDEIIPVACVIKNIPFSLSREELLSIIESLHIPAPYAFNYHYDPSGAFRGLAFANFHSALDTDTCVAALNGYDIQGRKLRVEYKKVLKAEEKERIEREKAIRRIKSVHLEKNHRKELSYDAAADDADDFAAIDEQSPFPADLAAQLKLGKKEEVDLNDPHSLEIYSRLLLFKGDTLRDEFLFSRSLNPTQRRSVHLIAKKLGLSHHSVGQGEDRHVVVSKRRIPGDKSLRHATSTLGRSLGANEDVHKLRGKKSLPNLRNSYGGNKSKYNDPPPLPDLGVSLARPGKTTSTSVENTNLVGAFAPVGDQQDAKLYQAYYRSAQGSNVFNNVGQQPSHQNANSPIASILRQPKGPDDQLDFVRHDPRGGMDPIPDIHQQIPNQQFQQRVEVQTGSALDF